MGEMFITKSGTQFIKVNLTLKKWILQTNGVFQKMFRTQIYKKKKFPEILNIFIIENHQKYNICLLSEPSQKPK